MDSRSAGSYAAFFFFFLFFCFVVAPPSASALLVLLGAGGAFAPGARAIDGVLVRLELRLVHEGNVAGDELLGEAHLEELARADEGLHLFLLLGGRGACGSRTTSRTISGSSAVFGAAGGEASHGGEVALGDGGGVKVQEAGGAEDMTTVEHLVADGAFFGFCAMLAVMIHYPVYSTVTRWRGKVGRRKT
ncbi:hypothetical protein HYQ46_004539 [Verticillium longisporum]|nr:hypothetical protein HYQ46_004539 [Verticillium longisporum]